MQSRLLFKHSGRLLIVVLTAVIGASEAFAQTSSFSYQGRLTDGGTAANGNYDLQFALWDSASGGSQVGSTLMLNSVAVSNGVFSVTLDFGANSFPGASRFLEISARPIGAGAFTLLTPRQPVMSTPYAVRSASSANADAATNATNATTATNATQLGGVAAGQYVQTGDSRLSDARTPTAGSGNYIQNTTSQQSSTNFNISGDGNVAGTLSGQVVNATTQFNISSSRFLSGPGDNTFAGFQAGLQNTGSSNSFFGNFAGTNNRAGSNNAFLGNFAGQQVLASNNNTMIGSEAGGPFAEGGGNNTAIGAGTSFSAHAGNSTLVGMAAAVVSNSTLTNATAIGFCSVVTQSNSLVLGSITGNPFICSGSPPTDTNVGIGTTAPSKRLEVGTLTIADGINLFGTAPAYYLAGTNKSEKGALAFAGSAGLYSTDAAAGDTVLRAVSGRLILQHGGLGAGMVFNATGTVSIPTLGAAGGTSLCRNSSNEISTCSSSLRYKANVLPFLGGLNIINRLRPISFTWKQDGKKDIGLGAEEVEQVAPLLTFRNDKGEIEGVKYNQLSAVFINAIKEQQSQIEALRQANAELNGRLRNLEQRRRQRVSSKRAP